MSQINLGKVVGDSAYEIAVKQGFSGTETEWLSILEGKDGVSPTVTVKTNTDSEYTLTITDATGSFNTPNLKGSSNSGSGGSYDDTELRQLISTNAESIQELDNSKADKSEIPNVSGLQPKAQEVYIDTAVMTLATVDNTDYYGIVPTTSLVITDVGAGTSSISFMTGTGFTATLPEGISFDGEAPSWKENTSYVIVIHNFIVFVSQGVEV